MNPNYKIVQADEFGPVLFVLMGSDGDIPFMRRNTLLKVDLELNPASKAK